MLVKTLRCLGFGGAIVLAITLAAGCGAPNVRTYDLTELKPLEGDSKSSAHDINVRGRIVGYSLGNTDPFSG